MSKKFVRQVFLWLADGCEMVADGLREPRKRTLRPKATKPAWYDEVEPKDP